MSRNLEKFEKCLDKLEILCYNPNRTAENSSSNGTGRSEPMKNNRLDPFTKYFRENRDEIINGLLVGIILIIIEKLVG